MFFSWATSYRRFYAMGFIRLLPTTATDGLEQPHTAAYLQQT